jgi:hypothetical protein
MSTIKTKQMEDANMDDLGKEIISGSVNVASEVHDDAMETPTTAPTIDELKKNDGINAKDGSAKRLASDEQSSSTGDSTNPVIEVENNNIDIWDGAFGDEPEEFTPDDLITKLQDENLALKQQVAMHENYIAILKGDNNARVGELKNLIKTQTNAITNANNRITAGNNAVIHANMNVMGKQQQLDSLNETLVRQANQITARNTTITRQDQQINAQAAHINTLKRQHDAKLNRVRKQLNKMVRLAVQRQERQAQANVTATQRFADEVEALIVEPAEDLEATESDGEGHTDEEQGGEVEVINLIDDDEDDDGDQVAGGVQPAPIEQSTRWGYFSSNEHRAAIQLASVVEQHVVDTQAVDDEEESPSKRVKLTK